MDFVFAVTMVGALGVAVALAWGRLRRMDERALAAAERQQRLARRLGGSPERPIEIGSPSVVDVRAGKETCSDCGKTVVLEEHTAELTEAGDRRVALVRCAGCGERWRLYFRLRERASSDPS